MQHVHITIWEQFNKELKNFICQKVNHEDHCNDILQELYLKIFINIGKLEKARNISFNCRYHLPSMDLFS